MLNVIRQFVKEEEGASAAEYALLMAIVAVVIVTALTNLSVAIQGAIQGAADRITASS
jgi:pilus assembly protein Flp/PilA